MKTNWSHLEGWRIRNYGTQYASDVGDTYGQFLILLESGVNLFVIATDGDPDAHAEGDETGDWEHVSAHARQPKLSGETEVRVPTWDEMCFLKSLFWEPGECVVQFHPAESNYVNTHPHVLHLWRNKYKEMPQPPLLCV